MSEVPLIADYNLLVLDGLIARCTTLSELQQAIASYPEDTKREGHVISGMQEFVARFETLPGVVEATEQAMARRGGREALERFSELMDFDEFMSRWDE